MLDFKPSRDLVVVLMGGPGAEREVSKASGRAVLRALGEQGWRVEGVEMEDVVVKLPEETAVVFNAIHGTFGEDGQLQAWLDELGVPYTGAGRESSERAFDKVASKRVFEREGVPTPACEIWSREEVTSGRVREMALPVVVKPAREGSSVGISVVRSEAQWRAALEEAARHEGGILVEQFVEGRELTVGVVGGEALPVIEITPPEEGWYDMATKYPWLSGQKATSRYQCPAPLEEGDRKRVQEIAVAAHEALGIEVYSRVDLLFNSLGEVYVLEANTIPGMTESSLLPKAAQAAGVSFGDLCVRLVELSLEKKSS